MRTPTLNLWPQTSAKSGRRIVNWPMLTHEHKTRKQDGMITRRGVLKAAGAAGVVASGIARAAGPVPKTPVDFAIPRGACDTHVHVVGDPAKYPMSPNRVYTPPTATADEDRKSVV